MQDTWLGKNVLNNFTWFYNSHMFMFAVFYVAVILHPWPGLPGYSHRHGHSVTWVCAHCPVQSSYACASRASPAPSGFLWAAAFSWVVRSEVGSKQIPGSDGVVFPTERLPCQR